MGFISPVKVGLRAVAVAWTVALVASLLASVSCQSQAEPEGLPNFGQVTKTLYRGAQPSREGFRALQRMGVTMVVNFRDDQESTRETHVVEALGMRYVAVPWSGHQEPSTQQVLQFLDLVRDNPQARIFVHCQRGADRTGAMIAAYRVVVEHASARDAVAEMLRYRYAHFWLPQLQRYVVSLPRLLQTDKQFDAYASAVPAAPAKSAMAMIVPVTP